MTSVTPQALIQKGKVALNQGDPAAAMVYLQQALEIDDHNPDAWAHCGVALQRLGRYPEAMIANTNAQMLYANRLAGVQPLPVTQDRPLSTPPKSQLENHTFWLQRASALVNAGGYELAIASYDKALALQPDSPQIWNQRGMALFQSGQYTEAIASFDQAIKLNPENYQPWHNRASVLAEQEKYEQAIADYDVALRLTDQQLWPAWEDRGMCVYLSQGYTDAISSLDQGLTAIKPGSAEYAKASGVLHQRKGDFQYQEGHTLVNPVPVWQEAKLSYLNALESQTFSQSPEQHLLTLQSLLTVCCHLGDQYAIQTMLPDGLEKRDRLLQTLTLSSEQRRGLKQELAGMDQLQVDLLAQSDVTQALLAADADRQSALNQWCDIEEDIVPLDWAQIQKLLRPQSALLYWHLSPAAISVFVLKPPQLPTLVYILPADLWRADLDAEQSAAAARQRHQLEDWLKDWQASPLESATVETQLQQLQKLLQIDRLCQETLEEIQQLILVLDLDFQNVPVHALFPDSLTITHLPTARIGLNLRQHRFPSQQFLQIAPQKPQDPEKEGLQQLYPRSTRLLDTQATKARTLAALKLMSGRVWIDAIAQDHVQAPLQSVIELTAGQTLTLEEVLQLDLSRFSLLCLSNYHPSVQSYIGFPTSFLMAGVAYVVSSQWWVEPIPRMLLLLNLNQRLQESISPVVALHDAQHWLRTLTYSALDAWSKPLGLSFQKLSQTLDNSSDECPYAHRQYWSGFKIMGNLS